MQEAEEGEEARRMREAVEIHSDEEGFLWERFDHRTVQGGTLLHDGASGT